jgi:hypothetical protein
VSLSENKEGASRLHGSLQKLYAATSEDTTNETIQPNANRFIPRRTVSTTMTALSKAQADAAPSSEGHMVSWLTPLISSPPLLAAVATKQP